MAGAGAAVRRSPAERKGSERARHDPRNGGHPARRLALVEEREPQRRRHGIAAYFWIGVAAIGVGLVVMVVSQVLLTQSTFRTSEAKTALARAQAENERLRLEKARAESPTLLEERARRDLGMVAGVDPERLALGPRTPNAQVLAPVGWFGDLPVAPAPEAPTPPAKAAIAKPPASKPPAPQASAAKKAPPKTSSASPQPAKSKR